MPIIHSLLGMLLILGIAFALSSNRRAVRPRVVLAAFGLQAGLAALVLYVPAGNAALQVVAGGVSSLLAYAHSGVDFLFGPLAKPEIGGASFAISALPVIIFFASLISILYYLRIMPLVIRWIGGGLEKLTGISRIESLCAASNIFVGQSEAPLVIRPYLAALSPAQLFCVMTVGMAGVAGTILAAYASMGIRIDYLVAAAFMSAPGGICMAKIMMPDPRTPPPVDGDLPDNIVPPAGLAAAALNRADVTHQPGVHVDEPVPLAHDEERPANIIMAASEGAQTGVKLAVAVGAMVLAFVALVALANGIVGGIGHWVGIPDLSFQKLLGYLFAPIFSLLGAPTWAEAMRAGGMFGTKIVLNEFVSFIDLGQAKELSAKTVAIVTFALCGFANFSSIAIQMAVTGSLAPNQRPLIAKMGLKALAAGALSNLMSAALAGLFLSL
ncbi:MULTISPECIES: NupC/NupG family nucleoside CNT transporter [Novosphingobium]|uniref:NupC/NupG family nucleoside CNT transporter n=1 Tax=Novosphingobium TaxID=165696 RepID=UPI00086F8C66|nr:MULTISPECIES: nucleoside transporter C-terminal domain-containing protein [Novosphingobium]MBN9142974.1 NupC/NupG family nucleoside CNT transporter [Novosphingobium sp.]MDR6706059.1 CNT family concentrative nucleoside transporter [Novosphingobium sp. 1748]ODU84882.1 MAG: nucleoside transporter [Novosphingobium sp. SCN 63-17]OJX89338.1 MAG: nucleoside transporter [Novosphingobium sp. 63-713]WJS99351.1 NupC/NupG family nucleoside CNT transporter [Novosphingobium humi]